MFIISLDQVLWTSIDQMKENGSTLKKKRDKKQKISHRKSMDGDYADNPLLLVFTHSPEKATRGVGFFVISDKIKFICFKLSFTLKSKPLKSVDQFTYLGCNISTTEIDVIICIEKILIAIDGLSIIWKPVLSDKIKCEFFHTVAVSVLLYSCTTWTLYETKKKLDGNYKRWLLAVLNKYWKQYPTEQQMYSHLLPISQTIQVRWTRHAGHCRWNGTRTHK